MEAHIFPPPVGINHKFVDATGAVDEDPDIAGIRSEGFADFDQRLPPLYPLPYNLPPMFRLQWPMLDTGKYIPFQNELADEVSNRACISADGHNRFLQQTVF